jgi:hypothetical protein
MAPGLVISDVSNCPFLILFANSIPLNVTCAFPNVLQRFSFGYSGITNHGEHGDHGDVYFALPRDPRAPQWLIQPEYSNRRRYKPQGWVTPLRRLPVVLINQFVQVLAGPDERLSGQDALGPQFGDGLMRGLTAVECDLLRGIMTADRFLEEA